MATNKPCVGVTTLRALASPYAAADVKSTVLAVIDARHNHLYFQAFDGSGEPLDNPRIVSIEELISSLPPGRIHVIGDAANLIESVWPTTKLSPIFTQNDAADIAWVARLGARAELAHELPKPVYLRAPDAKPPATVWIGPAVKGWLRWLFGATPSLSEAGRGDAAGMASLHAASFHRGWSDGEFESLLTEHNVIAHRATARGNLVGFILSRLAADEAEILSVAVAARQRGHGLARDMLEMHMRRLAGAGCRTIFLEVDETNQPARRLYKSAGFREVGRRNSYYRQGSGSTAALVLRRDI